MHMGLSCKLKASLRKFYGRHHELVDRYGTSDHNSKGRSFRAVRQNSEVVYIDDTLPKNIQMATERIKITKTFDNKDVHHAPVTVVLKGPPECEDHLTILVEAPLFNDPKDPGGVPGQPFDIIWEYEVVEVFLLNDQDNYLEVILSPHGQHYVLIQGGYRNKLKVEMPIEYTTTKEETRWSGKAIIPGSYLPPKVTKWNVYAMHGTGEARQFESLHGDINGKHEKPDFHDLSLFGTIDMGRILPNNWSLEYSSDEWRDYLQNLKYKVGNSSQSPDPAILAIISGNLLVKLV